MLRSCLVILGLLFSIIASADDAMTVKELAHGIGVEFAQHYENAKTYLTNKQVENEAAHGDDATFHTLGDVVTDGTKSLYQLGEEAVDAAKKIKESVE